MINKRLMPFVIVGLFLGIFAGLAANNLWQTYRENTGSSDFFLRGALRVGEPAPKFTLTALDGSTLDLEDTKGTAVILNFWATWCGPCRLEMPALQARYAAHASELAVLAINIGESVDTAAKFTEELGVTFPILMDEAGSVQRDYAVSALPTTFFIDGDGNIKAQHIGMLTESMLDKYLAEVGVGGG